MPATDLVGTVEAAEILGWSLPTLKRRARSGEVKPVAKMNGATGAYLFERSAIEALRDELARAS